MGRSRSRSRERRKEEKRGRPSDDYPSSRDYDRVEGSRRTFTYAYRPFLSSCPCPRADNRARGTDLSASCLIKETKLLLLMLLLRMHKSRLLITFFSLFVCMDGWMTERSTIVATHRAERTTGRRSLIAGTEVVSACTAYRNHTCKNKCTHTHTHTLPGLS
jgi:hypothetical protein